MECDGLVRGIREDNGRARKWLFMDTKQTLVLSKKYRDGTQKTKNGVENSCLQHITPLVARSLRDLTSSLVPCCIQQSIVYVTTGTFHFIEMCIYIYSRKKERKKRKQVMRSSYSERLKSHHQQTSE